MSDNLKAAQTGDLRSALIAARDTLAEAIDEAKARGDGTVAQLVAQYRATLADLAALPAGKTVAPKGVVTIDEAKRRRADRQSGATTGTDSGRGGRKRGA